MKKHFLIILVLIFSILSWQRAIAQCSPLSADDNEVCDNTTLHAPNPAPYTGQWTTTGNAHIVSPNDYNTVVEDLDFGPNTFIWTVAADNCSDSIVIYGIKIPVDAGPDQPHACSSTTLQGSNPSPGTGYWTCSSSQVVFDDNTSPTAKVSNLPIGDVVFVWHVVYNGCENTDTVVITNNTPYPVNAGADDIACSGDSIQLNGTAPGPDEHGVWSVLGGTGTFQDSTLYNTWVYNLDTGAVNVFRWTVYNDYCSASDTVMINNKSIHLQNFTDPGPYCTDVAYLSVSCPNNEETGHWKVIASEGTITYPDSCYTPVTGLNFDANTFRWIVDNGYCQDSIEVTVFAYPVVASAHADAAYDCDDTAYLYGNDPSVFGGTGVWSVEAGGASIDDVNSPTTFATNLNQSNPNIFVWTVEKNGCTANDTVRVYYAAPSLAQIAGPDTGYTCDSTYILNASPVNPRAVPQSWHWDAPGVSGINYNPDSLSFTTTVSNLPFGTTMFVWTVETPYCPASTDTIYVINNFPPVVDAGGPYDTVCGECVNLSASAPPPGGTGLWTAPAPITFTDPTNNITQACNLPFGSSILTWTVTLDQCSASDTVTVYNDQADPAICEDDFHTCHTYATIHAVPVTNGTGVWTTPGGAIIQDPHSNVTLVTNLDNDGNIFYWTVTNGVCSSTDTLYVYNDSTSVAKAGADRYICTDSVQMLANTPVLGTGQWTLISGTATFEDPTSPTTWVYNLQRGENQFLWTITKGACSSVDTVSIYNLSVDAYINMSNPHIVCTDTAVIIGNDPATQNIYDWQNPPDFPAWGYWDVISGIATIDDISSYITTIRNLPLDTTLVVWTVKNAYCIDRDTLKVVNNMPTQAEAGPDTVVCSTDLYTLHGNLPIRGVGHWEVVAGTGTFDNSTLNNTAVHDLDYWCHDATPDEWWTHVNTVNMFQWVIEYNGCVSRDTVRVINALPDYIDAGPDQTVCANEANLHGDPYECAMEHWWTSIPPGVNFYDPITGDVDSTDFNSHVENLQDGNTIFIWHKSNTVNGVTCTITDTTMITSLGYEEDVNAGSDDAVCDTVYKLSATPPSDIFGGTDDAWGYWECLFPPEQVSFEDTTQYDAWAHNLAYGTNILRWTIVDNTLGCIMTDDVWVINALPSDAKCGPDTVVCENQALLTANRPVRGVGVWSVIGGGATIINPTCQNFNCSAYAINLGPGVNTFLWTVTNTYEGPPGPNRTCSLNDTLVIVNNEVHADAGHDLYVCADTVQLNANLPEGATGEWRVAGGSGTFASTGGVTSSIYNDVVRNLTRGKNTFTWTLTKERCSDSDDLVVWDNLPYPDPDAGADQTICSDSTTLAANSITRSNVWYDLNGDTLQYGYSTQEWTVWGTGTIDDPTSTNTWVHDIPAQSQTAFIWHAYYHFTDSVADYRQTCELTDTVYIYNNSVTAQAGTEPNVICGVEGPGAEYTLHATQVYPPMSGIWTPVFNPGPSVILTPSAYNSRVINMQNGDHIYRWTVSATHNSVTCSASDTIMIRVRIPTTSVVALPDSFEVCDNQAPLQANTPIWGIGHWEDVYGLMGDILDPYSSSTHVINLFPGLSKWAWVIDYDGCVSTDTITVVNNTVYADADDRVDSNIVNICEPDYVLSATDPNIFNVYPPDATGYWTGTPGTIYFDNSTVYNTTVHNLSNSQANVLHWTITKGGCSAVSQLVINNNQFTIDADVTSSDNHMYTCEPTITLAGEQPSPGTGYWNLFSGGGNIVNPTLYNTQVLDLPANDTYLEWVVHRNGCEARDTVVVTNNMVTAQAGVDDTVCTDTTSLAAGEPIPPATGTWTTVIGPAVDNPNQYNSHVSGLHRGLNTFVWTVTKGDCTAKDTVNIWNNAPDPAIVEPDKEVCSPTTHLVVTVPPTVGTGVWTLLNGGGTILDSTSTNATVINLNPKENVFIWTVTNDICSDVDTLKIMNNHVVADAGPDDTVCTDTAQLFAVDPSTFYPGIGTGYWTEVGGGGTVDNSTLNNTTVSNLGFGLNRFRWTVVEGSCSATDDAIIMNNSVVATATDIQTCSFPVYLTGNNPVSNKGVWRNIGGLGIVENSTLYNSQYYGLDNGLTNTLRWVIYNESCADSVDITVTNNGFVVSAGPDITTCADTAVMNADDPSPGSGYWEVVAGSGTFDNSTNPNTIVRNLGQGTNIFRWVVNKNGCNASATVSVTNNSPSLAQIVGPVDTESCDGTITLSANHPTPYYADTQYWRLISGGGSFDSDSTNFSVGVSGLAPGKNMFVWTIEKGSCVSSDTITIVNNEVYSEAGEDLVICRDYVKLNATDPLVIYPYQGVGHWNNLSGSDTVIVNSLDPQTLVRDLPQGTTTFQWTVELGSCVATDLVQITNSSVEAVASDEVACEGDIQLHGNDPSTFGGRGYWELIAGSGTIANSTLYNTYINGVPTGTTSTLEWNITNGVCRDSVQIQVSNEGFLVSAGAGDTICTDTFALNAQQIAGGTGYWSLIAGSGDFDNSTVNNTIVRNLGYGDNVLRWTVQKGVCSAYDEINVYNSSPSPAIIIGPINTETCDGSITLTAQDPSYGRGYWSQISGLGLSNDTTANPLIVSGLSPNNNIFRWTVVNGNCSAYSEITIVNNQVQSDAGSDQIVCADTAQLLAVDPNTTIYGGTGYWTNLSGGSVVIDNSTSYNTIVRNLPHSAVTFQWTVVKGNCSAQSTVSVTNDAVEAVASDAIVCDTIATLHGNSYTPPQEVGYWTIGTPATAYFIDDSTNNDCQVGGISIGSNEFVWHIENSNCADSVKIYITNNSFEVSADANGSVRNICSSTYTLSGDNPAPGTGYWTKISGNGIVVNSTLFNSKVINLDNNPTVLQWTVSKNGCVASDQVTIINNEVVATASPHLYTCDGTVTLDGNNPTPGTGIWRKVVPSASGTIVDSTLYNTQITGIDKETTVALTWTVISAVGGCRDSVQVLVTNNDFDLSAGIDQTVCSDTAQLNADSPLPGTGYWQVIAGAGVFDNSTLPNTIVRNLGSGANAFSWTVSKNGCTNSASVTITNNSVEAYAGDDQLDLCVDTAILQANDPSTFGGTGYWTRIAGDGIIDNSTSYITTVRGLSRNDNTFRWTVSANGCSNFDDVVVRNNSFDVEAGLDQTVCADTALLNAVALPGGTGVWSTQGSTPATIDDPSDNTTVVRNLQQGSNTFRWTVTRNGCTFYDEVSVVNNLPNPPLLISNDTTVCNNNVPLQAVAPEPGTTGLWSYVGSGATIANPSNNTTLATDLGYGLTQFIWTVTHNGCSLADTFSVVNNGVTANAGGDITGLCQDFVSLNAVSPESPAYGWWSKADGQPGIIENSTLAITNVYNLGYGVNRFVWHVQKDICSATDTVIVINNSPSPAEVGYVPPTCDGTAILSATPPLYGSGRWSYIGTYPVVIASPSNSNTMVSNLEYGANVFRWTVTNVTPYATCSVDTTFSVINNQFEISAGNDQVICDSITYLEGETRPDMDSAYWTVLSGSPIIENTNDPNTAIILNDGASTVLKWTVFENGCSDDDIVVIQNKAVHAIAFDDEVCDSTATLHAVPPSSGDLGYWTSTNLDVSYDPSSTVNNPIVSGLVPGSNLFTWHIYNDYCSDSTTISINYLKPYVDAGPNVEICDDYYTMSASDPSSFGGTGYWSIAVGSADIANSTLYNTEVNNLAQGENRFVWTVSLRGCSNSDEVVIVNNKPTISVGVTQNICQSNTTLTGNEPDPGCHGLWTKVTPGPHIIVDSTLYNTQVINIPPGTHIFEWTVWNSSCTASEQLIVNNNSIEADAGMDASTCVDSVQLGASLPLNATGYWTSGAPGPIIANSTLFNTWVYNLNDGNNLFTWTVSRNGCSSSDYVVITNNTVHVYAGDDQYICENNTTLYGSNPGSDGSGIWTLESGTGDIVNPTANVTNVINIGKGANVFKWTVTRGECSGSDEVNIYNNEVFADAGAGDSALCGTEFELNAVPALEGTGQWSIVGGAGIIDDPTNYHTWVRNLARGENILRWTVTTSSCSNYDEIVINNITPSQAVTAPDKEICEDHTIITANEPVYGVGHWEVVSGPPTIVIDDSRNNATSVYNLGHGPNKFAWIITDTATGCSTYDTIQVINSSTTAFAGLDKEVCVDTFVMEASDPSPGTGIWTKVSSFGTFDNPTVHNTVVRDMGLGPNTYRWTVYEGICSAMDEVVITNNTPTEADAGDDQISCDGNAVLVGSTPGLDENGLWTMISGGGTIVTPTRYWTEVHGLSYGDNRFVWTITRGHCSDRDTVIVTNNNINVYAGEDQEVCSDSAFLIGNIPTHGVGHWELSGGSGTILDPTNNRTAVVGLAPGVNTFKWVIQEGSCTAYDEVQIINNTPTEPVVCNDTVYTCADSVRLCANMAPAGEFGYWTLLAGNGVIENSTLSNTLVTDLSPQSAFIWSIKKGSCVRSDTTYIMNGSVDAVVSADTMEVCGTDGMLAANNPLSGYGYWTLVSGSGVIEQSTNYITAVHGLDLGANTFRWTVVDGSCSDYSDMVLVNNLYPATANMADTNPICQPEVWVIGNPPDAGAIGTWSFSSGTGEFDDIHSPTTRAYNIGQGMNTARWTITKGGCSNYAEVQIINHTVHADAGPDIIVCDTNEVASLVANDPAPNTGYWTLVSGHLTIANTTAFSTIVSNVAYGSNIIKWTVEGGGCRAEDYAIVSNNFFTVSAGADRTVCDTMTVLTGTNPGAGGTGLWTVAGGHGTFENPTNYTTYVYGLLPGTNTFIWTVHKNGCSASDDVVITNGLPTAEAGGDKTTCVDSVIMSATEPEFGYGVWTLTGGSGDIVNPTLSNTVVRNLGYGQNTFRWTVYNGSCEAYDDITVYNYTVRQTAGDDQYICDTFTTLAADPPGPNGYGVWSVIGGSGTFENSTYFGTRVWGLYDGVNTFMWTVYENGCSGSSIVHIYNNRFDVDAGEDQVVTVPNATLNAQSFPYPPYIGTWTVSGGGGVFVDNHDPNTVVSGLQYGVNTFTWTVYNEETGCSASDNVNVIYNGFIVDAGPSQYICSDTTHLNATEVTNATTYWSIVLGGCQFEDPTDPHTFIYNINRGVNILKWNVYKNGFLASDTVAIYNYQFSTDAGENQDLCVDSTQLNATAILNAGIPVDSADWHGQWFIINGQGSFADRYSPNTMIYNLGAGDNHLRWEVERTDYPGVGVCKAVDSVIINYHKMPPSDFVMDPENGKGCNPLTVQFINNTPTSDTLPGTLYQWNFANQDEVTVGYDTVLSHTFYNFSSDTDSVYTVTMVAKVQVADGVVCTDTVQKTVTVWAVPVVDFAPIPSVTEFPQTDIQIENNCSPNYEVYLWDFGDGQSLVQHNYVDYFIHTYQNWGDYWITLEVHNQHCSAIDSHLVRIIAPVPISAGSNNVKGCSPLKLQLYAMVNYTTDSLSQYRWEILYKKNPDDLPDTFAVIHQKDPIVKFTEDGYYYATIYATGEGTNPPWTFVKIRTDTIEVYPVPLADFDVEPKLVMADMQPIATYNYSENAVKYEWNFGLPDSSAISYEFEPTFIYTKEGKYYITLKVWSDKGCMDVKTLEEPVVVLASGDLVFPTAFIPDPAGPKGGVPDNELDNSVFIPKNRSAVAEYHLQIFNRWGELIYESDDVNVGWDGYVNGKIAPQDVYVYKADVKFTNGIRKTYRGTVTLLR